VLAAHKTPTAHVAPSAWTTVWPSNPDSIPVATRTTRLSFCPAECYAPFPKLSHVKRQGAGKVHVADDCHVPTPDWDSRAVITYITYNIYQHNNSKMGATCRFRICLRIFATCAAEASRLATPLCECHVGRFVPRTVLSEHAVHVEMTRTQLFPVSCII
jgi:hypothetical protein